MASPEPNPTCCNKCNSMTSTNDGLTALLSEGFEHHNWYDIQDSASECSLCAVIWDFIENNVWDQAPDRSVTCEPIRVFADGEFSHRGPGPLATGDKLHSLRVQIPGESWAEDGDIFYLVAYDDDPAATIVPGRRESKELNPVIQLRIKQWLNDPSYDNQLIDPKLPRRVLAINPETKAIHLRESHGEKGKYAALSYCWGNSSEQITTLKSNYKDHIVSIPSRLPATIRDAIEVCYKIGISFLWVDALCIIQDDEDDKLDQISNMGLIYKNATVTILAACASSVEEGFLSHTEPDPPPTWLPLYIGPSGPQGTVYIRPKDDEPIFSSDLPIFWRAWTFQELLLSRRALIFDKHQIICKTLKGEFQPVMETYLKFQFNCLSLPLSALSPTDTHSQHRIPQTRLWGSIIQEYTNRDVSVFEDRLPALAGIVSELQRVWNDEYIVGFWRSNIIYHLPWLLFPAWPERSRFPGVEKTRRAGIPSWSWVSVPYAVQTMNLEEVDARLVSYKVTPKAPDALPLGEVLDASITLDAVVLKFQVAQARFRLKGTQPLGSTMNGVRLDVESPLPDAKRCSLVYLGASIQTRIFLVVEQSRHGNDEFRRVGLSELGRTVEEREWLDYLALSKRDLLVLK